MSRGPRSEVRKGDLERIEALETQVINLTHAVQALRTTNIAFAIHEGLVIRSGETLVVTVPEETSAQKLDDIHKTLKLLFTDKGTAVVAMAGVKIAKMEADDAGDE